MKKQIAVFWHRRDLRTNDNAGLFYALKCGLPVLPVFIFDTNILGDLENKQDKRISFIYDHIVQLQEDYQQWHTSLLVFHTTPKEAFIRLLEDYDVQIVVTNEDYEPYARVRDKEVQEFLAEKKIGFYSYKDQVIFAKDEVMKADGSYYSVFTPYSRQWKAKLSSFYTTPYPVADYSSNFLKTNTFKLQKLNELGFEKVGYDVAAQELDETIASVYAHTRDIPSVKGTTRLSPHLRFGTISIRKLVAEVKVLNEKLLNELIWREFYAMLLWQEPRIVTESFKKDYDQIRWRNNEQEFEAWCTGNTGYPIVDAGMRELKATGWMHNRVRMITASFLCKHLLVDWRWGEAWFAAQLLDYELASNNGGWQWCAGSGADAAPYFRIFNPYLQTEKFDPDRKYIRKWVPEFESDTYSKPIVKHEEARKRCLEVYKKALSKV